MSEDKKIDYLEVDETIPGQNYVCLSFISPETLMKDKEGFKITKFLQSYCKENNLKFDEVYEQYKGFCYKHEDKLQRDFDEQNNFQTSLRGIKIRGVYDTKGAAEDRAKKLSTLDSSFHVFIGQVGYWLPWDPNADKVESEHFQNSQLNEMMEKYQENNINRDMFYEEQKREKIKAAKEEALRKKKENEEMMAKKLDNIDDYEIEKIEEEEPVEENITDVVKDEVTDEVKGTIQEVVEEVKGEGPEPETPREQSTEEPVKDVNNILPEDKPADVSSENVVSEEIRNKLEGDDPWMQKVQREEDEKKKSE